MILQIAGYRAVYPSLVLVENQRAQRAAAMIVSFAVAVYFEFFCHADVADWKRLVVGVAVTTVDARHACDQAA